MIFGVTGGVTEAVLRRLQQGHSRVDMEAIKKSGVRGDEGIKTLTYDYNGREIRAAVVNGLANADKLLQQIKNHEVEYDFVLRNFAAITPLPPPSASISSSVMETIALTVNAS